MTQEVAIGEFARLCHLSAKTRCGTPGKNSIHLDLHTPDVSAGVARAAALGAKPVADFDEYGAVWTTMTDPEGNLFDIGAGS